MLFLFQDITVNKLLELQVEMGIEVDPQNDAFVELSNFVETNQLY